MGKCIGKAEGVERNEEDEPVAPPRENVATKPTTDEEATAAPTVATVAPSNDENNQEDHNFEELISEGEEMCLNELNSDNEEKEEVEHKEKHEDVELTEKMSDRIFLPTEADDDALEGEITFSSDDGITDVEFAHDTDESTLMITREEEDNENDEDGIDNDDDDDDDDDNGDDEDMVFDEDSEEGVLVVNVMCLSNEEDNNVNDETTTTTNNDKEEEGKINKPKDDDEIWDEMGLTNSTMQMEDEYMESAMVVAGGGEVGDILREVNKRHSKQVDKLMYEMKDCNATLSQLIQTQLTTQKQIIDQLCKKRKKAKKKQEKERKKKAKRIKRSQVSAVGGEIVQQDDNGDEDSNEDAGVYQMVLQQNQEIKQLMEMIITSVNEQRKENASVTSSTCREILQGQEEIKKLIQKFVHEPDSKIDEKFKSSVDTIIPIRKQSAEPCNAEVLHSDWLHISGRTDSAPIQNSQTAARLVDNTGFRSSNGLGSYPTCVNHFDTTYSAGKRTSATSEMTSKNTKAEVVENYRANGWTNSHTDKFNNQMNAINQKYTNQRNEIFERYNKRFHGNDELFSQELSDAYGKFNPQIYKTNQTYTNVQQPAARVVSDQGHSATYDEVSLNEFNSTGDSVPSLSLHSNASIARSQENRDVMYTQVMDSDKEVVSERIERLRRENQRIDHNINNVINNLHSTATYVPATTHWKSGTQQNGGSRAGGSGMSRQMNIGGQGTVRPAPTTYTGEIKDLRDSWVRELGSIKSLHSTVVEKKKAEKTEAKRKKKELDDFMKNYLRL